MSRILQDLKPLADTMLIRVAQPGWRSGYSCTETCISFWPNSFASCHASNSIDPEGGVPVVELRMLAQIAIVATFWPIIPSRAQKRLLEAYVDHTDSDIQRMVVGGSMNCNLIVAENLTTRIRTPVNFHVNGTLSLFVSGSNPENVRLQDIHTDGPYSVLTELTSSAERPATSTVRLVSAERSTRAVLKEATPLWNDFIDKVSARDEHNSLMNYIAHKCFYDDLLHKNEDGEWPEKPMPLSFKMERLDGMQASTRSAHYTSQKQRGPQMQY